MTVARQPDWPAIHALYDKGEMSVRDICLRFNISSSRLYRHLKAGNRQLRSRRETDRQPAADESAPCTGLTPEHRIAQLARALANQLREAELASRNPAASAAERERDARTLANLLRSEKQLAELRTRITEQAAQLHAENKDEAGGEDAALDAATKARLCQRLAQRLARLGRKGNPDHAETAGCQDGNGGGT